MGQTPRHAFPYPELTDPADVPTDMRELAEAIDLAIPLVPVIPPGGGGFVNFPVLDVGQSGQNRAGRALAVADFTQLGLSAPLGLWNLSNVNDASGNNRTLVNKGGVPFGIGINGQAATAAVFAGSTGQALYFDDQGTNDPLRIRTGSWGCWFRTAKRGNSQEMMSKGSSVSRGWRTLVGGNNVVLTVYSNDGTAEGIVTGISDVADDRWHFMVSTQDGTAFRLYVDGVLEAVGTPTLINPSSGPLNIGGLFADAATANAEPFYGRVDEAFVTADVLSEDQVRCLYCAKLQHALGAIPGDVRIAVHRLRKGVAFAVTDFTTQPLRLHNFTGGALTDQGSGNVALVNAGTAPLSVSGADGTTGGGYSVGANATAHLMATDAGLPSGTASRSFGLWFKTANTSTTGILSWGGAAGSGAGVWIGILSGGAIYSQSVADSITGPYAADGQWHFVAVVEDNAAGDGVRRKLYLDGRLVGGSTVLGSITLGGANRFRLGATADASTPMIGQIDGAFVTAYALTAAEVATLYAKGSQDLAASTKNAGDHVERVDGNSILATFDTLQSQYTVDLGVAA